MCAAKRIWQRQCGQVAIGCPGAHLLNNMYVPLSNFYWVSFKVSKKKLFGPILLGEPGWQQEEPIVYC